MLKNLSLLTGTKIKQKGYNSYDLRPSLGPISNIKWLSQDCQDYSVILPIGKWLNNVMS